MNEQKYIHALVNALAELHQNWHETLASGQGIQAQIYRAMSPEIPVFLASLDEDPELLEKISMLIGELSKAVEKDKIHDSHEADR